RLDMNHGFVHHIRRNQIARYRPALRRRRRHSWPGLARPNSP
ncbi:C2orf68 isoform 4, partial [Pongo abelii]